MFSSKTAEQGIIQTASLFQEMIKSQEKRDLDPALLAIHTFLGETADRPQCLDWISRVKNVRALILKRIDQQIRDISPELY